MIITATNYTCSYFTAPSKQSFLVLKTPASNIKLVSIYRETGDCKTVKNSGYHGMNASFFNSDPNGLRPFAIQNIALQDGKNVGSGWGFPDNNYAMDGTINLAGKSVICWSGSRLSCLNNVEHSTDAGVPQGQNSWAQGGVGLYLCDRNWMEKYTAEGNVPSLTENAARTGILINKSTNYVYLFANRVLSTVPVLRGAMMAYAALTNGGSAGSWAAIMTDGGRSTQLYTAENSTAAALVRGIPQIIALKNVN